MVMEYVTPQIPVPKYKSTIRRLYILSRSGPFSSVCALDRILKTHLCLDVVMAHLGGVMLCL